MRLRSTGLPLLFILGLLAAPHAAEAQPARVARIGILAASIPGPFVGEHSRVDKPVSANTSCCYLPAARESEVGEVRRE